MSRPSLLRRLGLLLLATAIPSTVWAAGADGGFANALMALALVLSLAKLGGHVAQRFNQPAVLGELMAGVALGNLDLLGVHGLDFLGTDPFLKSLAELGVVLLLFEVGLESTVQQMAKVGGSALLAAVLGVILPFALGFGLSALLMPEASLYVDLFIGATLTATSVGITARVLKDLGEHQSPEARVILGAAVIDDVLGLVILAAVSGIIQAADQGVAAEAGPILLIIGKAVLFLGGAVGLGVKLTPWLYRQAAKLRGTHVLLGVSLAFCFGLSWLASVVGLAPIVGAFAAGLVLEGALYTPFVARGEHQLEELIHPVVAFLAPIFFVTMGVHVDLATFADPSVLGLAGGLLVAAFVGKLACGLGVLDRSIRRLPVALGMAPRGEVGLIFAFVGKSLGVVTEELFSVIVLMVMLTTLVTPPVLAWLLRGERKAPAPVAGRAQALDRAG